MIIYSIFCKMHFLELLNCNHSSKIPDWYQHYDTDKDFWHWKDPEVKRKEEIKMQCAYINCFGKRNHSLTLCLKLLKIKNTYFNGKFLRGDKIPIIEMNFHFSLPRMDGWRTNFKIFTALNNHCKCFAIVKISPETESTVQFLNQFY